MKMTFRWYGADDPVTLKNISQIPLMHGIVSACYDVPVGKEWKEESINSIKSQANKHSLSFEVVESVPVHEDITVVYGTGLFLIYPRASGFVSV